MFSKVDFDELYFAKYNCGDFVQCLRLESSQWAVCQRARGDKPQNQPSENWLIITIFFCFRLVKRWLAWKCLQGTPGQHRTNHRWNYARLLVDISLEGARVQATERTIASGLMMINRPYYPVFAHRWEAAFCISHTFHIPRNTYISWNISISICMNILQDISYK